MHSLKRHSLKRHSLKRHSKKGSARMHSLKRHSMKRHSMKRHSMKRGSARPHMMGHRRHMSMHHMPLMHYTHTPRMGGARMKGRPRGSPHALYVINELVQKYKKMGYNHREAQKMASHDYRNMKK